jgi:lysozyme family protein
MKISNTLKYIGFVVLPCMLIADLSTPLPSIPILEAAQTKSAVFVDDVYKSDNHRYQKAFDNVIKEEGGYVNDPQDPGGETKYGISKRSYPDVDIAGLTLKAAAVIYKRDFYAAIRGDDLPSDMVAQEVMEQAVNMGVKTAVSFLQIVARSMGSNIDVDGKMGNKTLEVIKFIPEDVLLVAIKSLAIAHYLELAHERPPMRKYLNGWIKRVQF